MNGNEAYAYAWEHADRNADGSRIESSMVELIAANIDYDAAKARRGLAQRVLSHRKRPGQTVAEGAVAFPGLELYRYEPHRLLADDAGNVVENQHATPKVKDAEAARAEGDERKAALRAARERTEAEHFRAWAAGQYAAGRDPREITWDTCVRETGIWKDADLEPDAP